jgi:plasmid stabilization system protein ParE
LEKIRQWIALEAASDVVALRFIARLLDACEGLESFPERFPIYPHAREWRIMPFGNYLVFFQVREAEVWIGHIRHGARRPFGG